MAGRQLSHRNEGSATLGPTRTWITQQGLVAACVAAVAFLSYYATLLPGLDLGDSASFQTGLGSLTLTPRHAYPLYHGLGSIFVLVHSGEPARAANLASAVFGAIAVGLATLLATRLSESLVAGVAAGLFLAFSYTFWSQAITAEVYTLHLLIVGAASLALLAWADRPTSGRLALFYGIFALGFGNHLSMILLLPAFAVFLLLSSIDPLRPRALGMAISIAALGALQYAWNFRGLWTELEPPASLGEAGANFWVDVTKQDWRETLVMTVSEAGLQYRPSMYWFDLRQQFGVPGIVLAAAGICYVLWRWPRRGILLALLYTTNMAFAWTYNVGDVYVFFLPAHYVVALCAGAGVAAIIALLARLSNRVVATTVGMALLTYPAWRGYDTFPAVDRSWDDRAVKLLDEVTAPADSLRTLQHDTVWGLDANWQLQNAVEYYMRERKPELTWFVTEQLEWLGKGDRARRFDAFVTDNAEARRGMVVTDRVLDAVYGPGRPRSQHVEPHLMQFSRRIESIQRGTPYALAILRPDTEFPLDTTGLAHAWQLLAPGVMVPALRQYTLIVGRAGEKPVLIEAQDRPYRIQARVEPYDIDIRMESWLPTDTIRRAGFGHVVVNRKHALTLERGVSFVALGPGGGGPIYGSGLFAPLARHVVTPEP